MDEGDQDKADLYLEIFKDAAELADELGLEVHFGHGLTFDNVTPIAAIPQAMELNIGHFLIGESVFMGIEPAILEMRRLMQVARPT